MQMTKKVVSVILAVMMVVSMMSVMAVSANAATTDFSSVANGYYLVGDHNDWTADASSLMTQNPADANEYVAVADINAGAFKVVKVDNGTATWYPAGNNRTFIETGTRFVYVKPDSMTDTEGVSVSSGAGVITNDLEFKLAAAAGGSWYITADVNADGVTVANNFKVWNTDATHTITGNITVADNAEFAIAGKKTTNINGDITLAGQDSKVASTRANKVILTQPYKTGQVYGVPKATEVLYDGKEIVFDSISLTNAASKGGTFYVVDNFTCNAAVSPSKDLTLIGLMADSSRPTITVASTSSTRSAFNLFNPANGTNLSIEGIDFAATVTDEKVIGVVNTNTASSADVYSTITIKDSEISGFSVADNYGAVYLHGYSHATLTNVEMSGNGEYDVWGGAATDVTIKGGSYVSVYLNGGVAKATIQDAAAINKITAAEGTTIAASDFSNVNLPYGYELQDNSDGSKTVVFNPVTAQFTKSPAAYKVNVGSTISNVYVKLYKNGTALTNVENAAEKDNWELVINDDTAAEITRKSVAAQITYSVKGLKAGEYTLTFRNVNDYDNKATATLTVSNVLELTWSNTGTRLVENGAVTLTTAKFNGEVVDLNDYDLTFDDPTIATFDGTTLTPLKAGTMKITATSKSDPSVSASANVVFKNAVATDGTTYYESLYKALTGVADGGTVTLLQDTTESVHYTGAEKNMTLDLNGKTLTGSSQYAIRVDRGVLTVEDNSDAQTGTVHYGSDYAFVVSHVAAECESKIILKSGTFIGKTTVAQAGASGGSGANKKYYGGDLEVLGGTFITEADTNETYDTNGNFKFTLNKLDYSDAAYPGGKYSESNIVVKGGTFKQFDPFNNMAEGASTNFVDPEYKSNFVDVGNGEYTVVPKTYLAQVGETKYETLDEAVAAAIASGNDIYLLDACNKAPNNTFNKLTVNASTTFVVHGNGFYGASFAAKTDIANGAWVNTWTISGSGKNAVYTYTIEAAALVVLDDQGEVDHYPTALYQALNGTSGVRATSGQTVKLLDNINLDANKSVIKTSESDVTLDLNGKTLTGVREDFLEVTNGKTLNIENGTIAGTGNVKVGEGSTLNLDGAAVGNIEAGAGATITFANGAGITGDVSVPEGYKVVTDETTGTKTVVAKTYLAQVGETKYETFADALAAAQDGDTIELLRNATIDANTTIDKDVTIDLGGKVLFSETYRMSINSANTVTVKNGRVNTRQITLGSGAVLNVESDAEIKSAGWYAVVVNDATLNSTGKINCGASMFLTTYAISLEHPNGIVNINGGKVDATYAIRQLDGTSNITDGVLTGSNNTFDYHGGTVNVSGGQFSVPVKQEYCADGYIPVQTKNSAGYYTVEKGDPANPLNPLKVAANAISDGNKFGLGNIDYLKGAILGVQKKNKASVDASETSQSKQETGKDIRFVAVLDTDIINDPDVTDYGFVLAKVGSDKTTENANFNGLKAFWGNGEKTVSAKNTKNNVCSSNTAYGDTTDSSTPYKYITCAVNGVGEGVDGIKVAARFYVKKGDKIYYGKYAKNNYEGGYTGVIAGWADVQE